MKKVAVTDLLKAEKKCRVRSCASGVKCVCCFVLGGWHSAGTQFLSVAAAFILAPPASVPIFFCLTMFFSVCAGTVV